jgi:hypothetical protein
VARVSVSTLPPLQTSVRLTPAAAPAIAARIRRRLSGPAAAAAGASGLVVLATVGWLLASRVGATTPAVMTTAAATASEDLPPSAPPDSVPSSVRIDRPERDAASASPDGRAVRPAARIATVSDAPQAPARNGQPSAGPSPTAAVAKAPEAARGKLRVRAEPSTAEIFVDDSLLNQGVVIDALVRAGKRRLRIAAAGFETYEVEVEIVSGQTMNLSTIRLTPREGQ